MKISIKNKKYTMKISIKDENTIIASQIIFHIFSMFCFSLLYVILDHFGQSESSKFGTAIVGFLCSIFIISVFITWIGWKEETK